MKTHSGEAPYQARGQREERYLKQVCARYLEESITEEQVQRVLAPVLAMIRAGAFDRQSSLRQ